MSNERILAVKIIHQLHQKKASLNELLAADAISECNNPALLKQLCYGVCRYYFELEEIANQLLTKKVKDELVWLILISGIYQLRYMNMPDYAVVKESVEVAKKLKKVWAKGFINAVLRNYCRQVAQFESIQFDTHPSWFIEKVKHDWPCDWQALLKANDEHPPMTLRVNPKKTSRNDYLQLLKENGIDAKAHDYAEDGIQLTKPCEVAHLPKFADGYASVQDASPQLTTKLFPLASGLRVLDACSAPGGKACHILEHYNLELECVDIDAARLIRVTQNLERLKLSAKLSCGDAANPEDWWSGRLYDRILLDAPCSATGVIRRHPDIKLLRTEADVSSITRVQQTLLEALWPLLKPNGYLLYATCSVLAEENDLQIKQFVEKYTDAHCQEISYHCGIKSDFGLQILPSKLQMDGFYYSLIKKV